MALTAWFAPSMGPVYLHTLRVRVRRHRHGHLATPGDAAAVIRACIKNMLERRFFTASPGHFDMFWDARRLFFERPWLLRLGEGERLRGSLSPMRSRCGRGAGATSRGGGSGDRPANVLGTASTRCRSSGQPCARQAPSTWSTPSRFVGCGSRVGSPSGGSGDRLASCVRSRTYSAHREHGRQPEHRLQQHDGERCSRRPLPRRSAAVAV